MNRVVEEMPVAAARPDPESAEWLRVLAVAGPHREAALARLHAMLLRKDFEALLAVVRDTG